MNSRRDPVAAIACRLLLQVWVGAMIGVGLIAAPVLFSTLSERSLAGELAGRMFSITAWLGLGCGALLWLLLGRVGQGRAIARTARLSVATMVMLTCIGHFGIQPRIEAIRHEAAPGPVAASPRAKEFGQLHAVSTLLFVVQLAVGLALVARGGGAGIAGHDVTTRSDIRA